jgi:arginyl-tRNA synthetase
MIKDQLAATIASALDKAKSSGDLPLETVPPVGLEMPRSRAHGDWATNIALVLAPQLGLPPREVASKIVGLLPLGGDSPIAKADIAGPGFINLTLRPDWLADILKRIEREDDSYGCASDRQGRKVLVEFVSTNPNGPITVAGGRNAAIGDVLASLLTAVGCDVRREYYINDALNSVQMNNFGRSVFLRYLELLKKPLPYPTAGEGVPDWFYQGEYVTDVARKVLEEHGVEYADSEIEDPQTVRLFRDLSEQGMVAQQKVDLEAFGVRFDNWFSEATLHADGRVAQAIEELTRRGHTYEKDGALWLRSTAFGDDKDRVLMRNDGTPTYIAGDAAYHKDKLDRGFGKTINVWGADHAGYVARTKAAVAALGYDPDRLDVLLYQLVRIVRGGELVQSSKRKGNVLELKADLIDEIGKDAARFFFLMRSPHTDLDIDIDLAKKTEKDNPVYYVQYAHARIVQTLEKAREARGQAVPPASGADLSRLIEESETDLIKKLSDFPDEVRMAAADYAPQRITQYTRDLSALFHGFYDAGNRNPVLRVVCDDVESMKARLVLVNSARIVLKNALGLLGVSAPDQM